MTPAQLHRALLGEGLAVDARTGWGAHERDGATGKPFGPVHGVMIHHTAAHNALNVIWNGRSDLPGPLAHAYIDKRGVVHLTSAGRANHAGLGDDDVLRTVKAESYGARPPAPNERNTDGNDAFYGFECENLGDGKDPWPAAQYIAMVRASAAICRHYEWTAKSVIGHLEWTNQKIDPRGFTMVEFRQDVKDCLALPPGVWPKEEEVAPEDRKAVAAAVWAHMADDVFSDDPEKKTSMERRTWGMAARLGRVEKKVDEILALLKAQQ